jgi:anti-sigma B factor antagonist
LSLAREKSSKDKCAAIESVFRRHFELRLSSQWLVVGKTSGGSIVRDNSENSLILCILRWVLRSKLSGNKRSEKRDSKPNPDGALHNWEEPYRPTFVGRKFQPGKQARTSEAPLFQEAVPPLWQRKKDALADSGLHLQCQAEGAHCVVSVSGRITNESSPALRAELLRVLEGQSYRSVTMNLQEVSYVDTSGVAILMEVLQAARAAGKIFQLQNLQQRPRYLFQAIGLLHFFDPENREDGEPIRSSAPNAQ